MVGVVFLSSIARGGSTVGFAVRESIQAGATTTRTGDSHGKRLLASEDNQQKSGALKDIYQAPAFPDQEFRHVRVNPVNRTVLISADICCGRRRCCRELGHPWAWLQASPLRTGSTPPDGPRSVASMSGNSAEWSRDGCRSFLQGRIPAFVHSHYEFSGIPRVCSALSAGSDYVIGK